MLSAFLALIDSRSDRTKFQKIYEKYSDLIYNVAFAQVNDYHMAQDATQEALMRIAKAIKRIDDIDSQYSINLICVIAKCAAIYTYNKSKNDEAVFFEDCSSIIFGCDDYSDDYILEALQQLDKKYSSVLLLKLKFELTDREIADILDLPFNTVKSRVYRGRLLLADMLENDFQYG